MLITGSSVNLSISKVSVSAFAFHASNRSDTASYLWVCRGSAPITSRNGPPELKGWSPVATLYAVDSKWQIASTDCEIDCRSAANNKPRNSNSSSGDAEWIYSAFTLDSHSAFRSSNPNTSERLISVFAKNSISTDHANPELWTVEIQPNRSNPKRLLGEPVRTVYSLKGGPQSQHIVSVQLPLSSIVDASYLVGAGSAGRSRARSFSFLVEALCEYGLQRYSFSAAAAAVMDVFTRTAPHCLTDYWLPATFTACVNADLVAPLPAAAGGSDSKSSPAQHMSDARRAMFDLCLRLSQSVAIAHFVSETVQEKNSDTPQLLLPYVLLTSSLAR